MNGQVTLSAGSSTGRVGQTVAIPLTLAVRNQPVSALQWTIRYAPSVFSAASVTIETAAARANKTIDCAAPSAGEIVCMETGRNAQPMQDGVVATLNLTVQTGASTGVSPITVAAAAGSTPSGDAAAVGAVSGSVSVQGDPSGISALSCSTATLLAGGSATCTATLGAAAGSAGVTVALGSASTGGAQVTTPASVRVNAGSSSAGFTASAAASGAAASRVVVTASTTASSRTWTFDVPPATVSVTPAGAVLYAGQTAQFQAAVANAASSAVRWSRSPSVGTLSSSGLFTAPASIAADTDVTVVATSVSDPGKSAAATVRLLAPRNMRVLPASVSAAPGQAIAFRVEMTGVQDTRVAWSISPRQGAISASGVYTAAGPVGSTVTVTATSVADPSRSASAYVLIAAGAAPAVRVTVTPPSATVAARGSVQFTAAVVGTSNGAVTWSVQPATGSISAAGLYRAPDRVASASTVTVTAASVADPTKRASATISLRPLTAHSLFGPAEVPASLEAGDADPIELGVVFSASEDGWVAGVRFYKGTSKNKGTHTATLWTIRGEKLATATFGSESASGWQSVRFAEPVAVDAGAVYVVSYFAPQGRFSATSGYFGKMGVSRPPLAAPHARAGVYREGSAGYPSNSVEGVNYWVDPIFEK